MKKLMIAAVVAAVGFGAFADGTVVQPWCYDMRLSVKTSWCNEKGELMAKFDSKCEPEYATFGVYRKQYALKIQGAFWGCGCQVIGCPKFFDGYYSLEPNQFIFWSMTALNGEPLFLDDDGALLDQTFEWMPLNVIGKNANVVEGLFKFTIGDKVEILGAGYGSAKIYDFGCESIGDTELDATQLNYIKTMKGYCAGWFKAGDLSAQVGCVYCGKELDCTAYDFCATCDDNDNTISPLYGNWLLKVNPTAVKKLEKGATVWQADGNIPSRIKTELKAMADRS